MSQPNNLNNFQSVSTLETEYPYSNENTRPQNESPVPNEIPAPLQENSRVQENPRIPAPPQTTIEQILETVLSLNYDMVRSYVSQITKEGREEDLKLFRKQNLVFLVVKELIQNYQRVKDINNTKIQDGLLILKLLVSNGLQMNVYEGGTPSSKVRPANLAAGADSTIGIPILEILMEGHSVPGAIGNMSILQPYGFYRVGDRGEIILPKDERAPIFDAIEKNKIETVEFLIKAGSRINAILEPSSGDSPLAYAILKAINIEIATLLFKNRANVNFVDRNGEPLLQCIIRNQFNWEDKPDINAKRKGEIRLAFVDLIANSPFYSPAALDLQGYSAVDTATLQGCPLILDMLLKMHKFREELLDSSLARPFALALERSSYASTANFKNSNSNLKTRRSKIDNILKYFLRRKDYSLPQKAQLAFPLIESAIVKDEEMLRLLLARNLLANSYSARHLLINTILQEETNPITYAILKNKFDSLKILAEHPEFQLSVNQNDSKGRIPLMQAMGKNDLDESTTSKRKDLPENAPWVVKSSSNNINLPLINFLLNNGVNPSIGTITNTPLILAIQNGLVDLVRLFIQKGADVNKETRTETPLLVAVKGKSLELMTLLLDKGANPNKELANETPLLVAIGNKSLEIVNLLLERGADPNKPSQSGTYPLLLAMELKEQAIIDALKARGARADALLIKAAMSGSVPVVQQLLKDGLDPSAQITIDGKNYNAYDVSPSIDVRLLLAPYYEREEPRFVGFAEEDFDKFKRPFLQVERGRDEGTTIPAERENSLCPICFLPGRWDDGCMYQSHNCKQIQDLMQKSKSKDFLHIHEKLYTTYNENGSIKWCTHCNRLCTDPHPGSHRHYDIGPPIPIKSKRPAVLPLIGNASLYAKQCYTNRGGDIPEKFVRYQKLYDFMCYLNTEFIGKISANIAYNLTKEVFMEAAVPYRAFFTSGRADPASDEEQSVVTSMLEAIQNKSFIVPEDCGKFGPGVAVLKFRNAPNVPRPPQNVDLKPTVIKQDPFNESSLPEAPVPPVEPKRVGLPEGVNANNVDENDLSKFNDDKQAKIVNYKERRGQYMKNYMAYQRALMPYRTLKSAYEKQMDAFGKLCKYHKERHSDGRDLYQFHHRQSDGEVFDHEDSLICKEGLVEFLDVLSKEAIAINCFDTAMCDGFIHPAEVKDLFTTPDEKIIWNEYRRRFNRNPPNALVPQEGGIRSGYRRTRKTKRLLKTRKAKRYNRTRKH